MPTNEKLKSFVERIENLEAEKTALGADIREVYSEAKSAGFDVKIMKKTVAIRKMTESERQEQEALIDTYMDGLGMLAGTPLGDAAAKKSEAA